ncbi:hypothetical protein EDC04DRAFT_2994991 [Pisolithus marmoratus]|nr:hypothetical protein EDC04DRAFT_2994991 [Pisolithus marmoratus]
MSDVSGKSKHRSNLPPPRPRQKRSVVLNLRKEMTASSLGHHETDPPQVVGCTPVTMSAGHEIAPQPRPQTSAKKPRGRRNGKKVPVEAEAVEQDPGVHPASTKAFGAARFLLLIQQVDFQLNGILEFLQRDPWPVVNDELDLFAGCLYQAGLLELESLPDSANGDIVLSDSFATSIFRQNFLRIFNKDDEDFVEMVFNTTFDIQSERRRLCTSKWLLRPGKLFSRAPGVLIQIATHYQYSSGQQCLRVTTVARNCAEAGSSSIAASFDQGAAIALMARIAVSKGEIDEEPDVLQVCCYRKEDPATFRLSDNFRVYPQFMFHTWRSQFLQVFNNSPDGIDFYSPLLYRILSTLYRGSGRQEVGSRGEEKLGVTECQGSEWQCLAGVVERECSLVSRQVIIWHGHRAARASLAYPSGDERGTRTPEGLTGRASSTLLEVAKLRGLERRGDREQINSGSGTTESSLTSSPTTGTGDLEQFTPRRPTTATTSRGRSRARSTSAAANTRNYNLRPAVFPPLFREEDELEQKTEQAVPLAGRSQPATLPRPTTPSTTNPAMSYQIININEPAKAVPLFRGDYANKEEPSDWFTEFQLSLPTTWTEAMKVDRFGLQLAAGSYADEWFTDLPSSDKADMASLKAAFLKRWPANKRLKWTKAQQRERIRALTLDEEDVGKWIETEGGGDYGHVIWATKVMRLALSMGDTEGKLIEYAVEEAPTALRNELEEEYENWNEFVEAVRKVKVKKLLRSKETKKGEQELRNEIADLRQRISQITVRHTAQVYPARTTVRTEGEGAIPGHWGQLLRTGPAPLPINRNAVVPRIPLTRAQILEKAGTAPHRANTEAGRQLYEADIVAWHRAFGDVTTPALERPYPLKPGTAAVGSGECFNCGMVTDPPHVGSTCTARETIRPHETRWRQLVAGMLRRATQLRANPAPVQYVWPVAQQGENQVEANAPHVYTVAAGDGWQVETTGQNDQQEDQWEWTTEGNY